jgi:hypothetical protein
MSAVRRCPAGALIVGCCLHWEDFEVCTVAEVSLNKDQGKPFVRVACESVVEGVHPSCFSGNEHHVCIHAAAYGLGESVRILEVADSGRHKFFDISIKKALDGSFLIPMMGREGSPGESIDGHH